MINGVLTDDCELIVMADFLLVYRLNDSNGRFYFEWMIVMSLFMLLVDCDGKYYVDWLIVMKDFQSFCALVD